MFSSVPRRTAIALGALLVALASIGPPTAAAATSKYPPSPAARGFGGSAAGWTASASNSGICLPPLICASVTNSFEASGGADGGGFIRSAYTGVIGVTAVGGITNGVWESPAFTYGGVGGEPPAAVGFSLDRRSDVDQLLAVAGNSAEYTVRLIDLSDGGAAMTVIGPTTLAGARSWTGVGAAPIDPRSLTLGHEYRIQITSSYSTGTTVLVSGNADYDNVTLFASDQAGSAGGGNGRGAGGKGGGAGKGALSAQRLGDLLRRSTPGTAVLRGRRLFVRVRCPRRIGHACRTTAQGLLSRRRPATARRTVRLRSGRSRLLVLRVKPKARARVAKRKRLLFRQKVRAGRVTATVYKQRRLVRR